MISFWETSGLPVTERNNSLRDERPASKSSAEELIPVKVPIVCCHESFRFASEIWPWRARICHSPRLAWKMPIALARTVARGIRSSVSAAVMNLAIDVLSRP